MPLAQENRLAVPAVLPLCNNRKPQSLQDILRLPDGQVIKPLQMTTQQKSAFLDLSLYRFAQAQLGNRYDPARMTHSTYIKKASVRREIGEYTNAVIEGMCIHKELSEDKLYAVLEIDLDRINLKDPNQSHIDLLKVLQLHASPTFLAIPGVKNAFERLDRTLATLLVPYMNASGIRRNFTPEHLRQQIPLAVDPEVAIDNDSDSDNERYYVDPTLELDFIEEKQTVSNARLTISPTSNSNIATALESADFGLGYRMHAEDRKGKVKVESLEEPRLSPAFRTSCASDLQRRRSSTATATATAATTAAMYNESGEMVLGTFTPLRCPPSRPSRVATPDCTLPVACVVGNGSRVRQEDILFARDTQSFVQGSSKALLEDEYEILQPMYRSSHSDSNSSQARLARQGNGQCR